MTIVEALDDANASPDRQVTPKDLHTQVSPARAARPPADRARARARVVACVLLAAFLLAAAGFWATGGRWFVVRTPSMGTAAPVGTLVLTRPTTVADLHIGDVVTFHPTDTPALTYTHRVVAITNGRITTRGDINGAADPWRTGDNDLVGKTVAIAPGIGFVARALPLLTVGGLLVTGLTHWWLRPDRRGPARLIGLTLLYMVAALMIRPFVALKQLATTTGPDGASITAVSTGILPIRVQALPGHGTATPTHLDYGQLATLRFSGTPEDNRYALMAHIDLTWTGWAVLVLLWSLPLLWVLLVGFRRHPHPNLTTGLIEDLTDDDPATPLSHATPASLTRPASLTTPLTNDAY